MKQLVSILIPAYNAEVWIADTLRSAIAQTWPRKEIIVVDDGSTDQTFAVARRFASKEVAVVTQKNQGASAARNHALSLSQGDYIQWLDADDLLSPDKIASQIGGIEEVPKQSNTVLVGMGLLRVPDRAGMRTATWLVSRELTDATGPWDNRLFVDDDGEYFCRAIVASDGSRFIPEAKVLYRVTPSSRLSYIGWSDKKKDAQVLSMKLHVKYIRSLEDSDRVRTACTAYIQNWLLNFYPERPDLVAELEALAATLGR